MVQAEPGIERARTFVAEPAASRKARHFLQEWLKAHALTELAERASLVVSELAANAVLHTSRPFTIALDVIDGGLRLEVVDSAPDRGAQPVPTTGSAVDLTSISETGRGLQIVSSLVQRWGVVRDANIKTIWCELEPPTPAAPAVPEMVDRRPAHVPGNDVHHFVLRNLPVRPAIASGLDLEDVVRDVRATPADHDDAATAELLQLVEQSASPRLAGRHEAMHAASQNLLVVDIEFDATDEAMAATGKLAAALAERPRRSGRIGPSEEVVALRAWLVEETLRQRRGSAPRPYPTPAGDDIDWLWENTIFGYVGLDDSGAIVQANAAIVSWLDLDREQLQGRVFASLLADESQVRFDAWLRGDVGPIDRIEMPDAQFRVSDGMAYARLRVLRDGDRIRVSVDTSSDAGEVQRAHARAASATARTDELIVALQRTLIPPAPPEVPGLDVAAAYHPALGEVGGDFYDVFEVAENDWCVVLGDVSGKGVDAAIVTAAARLAVRGAALREPTPSALMRVLNTALIAQNSTRFCTVVVLRLQIVGDSWVATLTTGGHPFPLLIRHGTATKLGRAGSLLGVFEDVEFHDVSIKLATGDALVLFTDGIIEARNATGDFFGDERLEDAVVVGDSATAIVDNVLERVLAFEQGGTSDDIAVVVIRRSEL